MRLLDLKTTILAIGLAGLAGCDSGGDGDSSGSSTSGTSAASSSSSSGGADATSTTTGTSTSTSGTGTGTTDTTTGLDVCEAGESGEFNPGMEGVAYIVTDIETCALGDTEPVCVYRGVGTTSCEEPPTVECEDGSSFSGGWAYAIEEDGTGRLVDLGTSCVDYVPGFNPCFPFYGATGTDGSESTADALCQCVCAIE